MKVSQTHCEVQQTSKPQMGGHKFELKPYYDGHQAPILQRSSQNPIMMVKTLCIQYRPGLYVFKASHTLERV